VINQAQNKFHISVKNINVDKHDFRQMHVARIGKVYIFKVQNKLGNPGCFSLIQVKTQCFPCKSNINLGLCRSLYNFRRRECLSFLFYKFFYTKKNCFILGKLTILKAWKKSSDWWSFQCKGKPEVSLV
jgi:hypothetical protein